jgi:primosomal protein N' (replication factor Y)
MVCRFETPIALQPSVEMIDLRPLGKGTVFSPLLVEAIRAAIDRKAGVVLFLNRKGYAGALACRDCGQVPRCNSCRVALAYYRHNGLLSCRYCGVTTAIPSICASCAGHRLQLLGEGTERIEEEAKRLFPGANLIRADGDTMRTPSQAAALWKVIKEKQWDILVGTQLVLRDYAVPHVGLVGVVHADAGLSLPDFRAAERTYHMLRDAVALACPSSDGGRAIIQSYLISHHALQAVLQHDDSRFISEELSQRMALGYPPAVHLITLQVSGTNEKLVHEAAVAWGGRLQAYLAVPAADRVTAGQIGAVGGPEGVTTLGPVTPPVPKVRGRYRRQILVKSPVRERGTQAVRETLEQLERVYPSHTVKFDVDVDPVEMW